MDTGAMLLKALHNSSADNAQDLAQRLAGWRADIGETC